MKILVSLLLLLASSVSLAVDYQKGQCPVLTNCALAANPVNASTFSDTFTFQLGNWPETYGVYDYTSSVQIVALGEHGTVACGRGCVPPAYDLQITSATIDGVLLTRIDAYHWSLPISLSPGVHILAIQGTATGATWYAHETGFVEGLVYTLVPNPPCTGDECGGD